MHILRNADLKPYNTFGIHARAEYLARFKDADQLRNLLGSPDLAALPKLILGSGSNVLLTGDVAGAVLVNEVPGIDVVREDDEHIQVRAGAGVTWHDFVMHCVDHGWGGIENLSLIPGKVGAAPMQNIGAYGVEIKDVFESLEAVRRSDGELVTFDGPACEFGYRESFFKRNGRDRFVIMSVTFRLDKTPHRIHSAYGNLKEELGRMGVEHPSIRDVSEAVIAIRRSKLPDPTLIGNAGSFFKNPVVDVALAETIRKLHPDLIAHPAGNGKVKLAAGWLIERAGWKGFRENDHGVHDRQALVLVNHGSASGSAILNLSERIMHSIRERFGVELEREVNVI